MKWTKIRKIFAVVLLMPLLVLGNIAHAGEPAKVIVAWYDLILELVRHTPTYSPPVASRAFAYLGVATHEAIASGRADGESLAGQINGLTALPRRESGKAYDDAVVVYAAVSLTTQNFFGNTGPTGERAMKAMLRKQEKELFQGVAPDVIERSKAYGAVIAGHVLSWSESDGGAVIENMGFPLQYDLIEGKSHWVPTSAIQQQQAPLLPNWGKNRTFAMPSRSSCPLPPPPEYSEEPTSQFYLEAKDVYDTSKSLTEEQEIIARFWSDDPMMSPTPPGHWIYIALRLLEDERADAARAADVLARLGIAIADGFIGCWDSKYQYDLLRPITYIRRTMDPKWNTLLITPPFPEYPSGHSSQSGAAEVVMASLFGESFAFVDATHERDGIKPRKFASFRAAAEEAAISRLYGGIHFRAAIERGLEQGRCIGKHAAALKTKR
jgi:hypothetical protein